MLPMSSIRQVMFAVSSCTGVCAFIFLVTDTQTKRDSDILITEACKEYTSEHEEIVTHHLKHFARIE